MGIVDPDEAAIVTRGIELEVWSLPQVKAWVDQQIAQAADGAPDWLIEASLGSHILDVRHALLPVAGESPLLADEGLALALVGERLASGSITAEEATRAAFAVVVGRPPGELVDRVYHLDCGFDLAADGRFGTTAAMERETTEFFGNTVQATPIGQRLRAFLAEGGQALRGGEGRRRTTR